ncbi:MAG TPA: pentapeptide repeat-containing protein [Pyrinomonadaceae bacterium]|nr:pentapeptide repeat-containing protein [Pyrinomonadaceae bacterium]
MPSRSSFQNGVDLAAKVAKDVQGWLVREYRRLSAERSEAPQSSRRTGKIDDSLKRLAASTTQTLPSGNSSDLLAWQLRQWFEALAYPIDSEPETGPDYTDLLVRIPGRRKQFTRVLVRAISGEIQGHDVKLAHASAVGKSIDEVWLVCFRRISPSAITAAKEHDNVELYTFDELIEDDVDFKQYFDWLDTQVQAEDIDRFYVPLAVTVNEVDASGTLRSDSTYDDISKYVDRWMGDTDGEHLSLLGEFGTGKSWFAFKYAHDMVARYREAQKDGLARPRVPLVIRLREYARGFKDVGALLTDFVFREHQINIGSFAVLETLNRMGRLLFIFDGFDEMAARVDQQKMVDNFWSLASVLGPGSKAILTCRTEYFQFAKQAREVLSGNLRGSSMKELLETARFQVATLQMFDEERLRTVLSRRSDDQKLIDAVMSNQRLIDLGRRPVMVDLLIEAMPGLEAENADLARVYYQAVQRKMERDISLGRTFTSMADKIFFMCEISWEMLSTQELKINYKQIPDRIREYFGSRVATAEEDHWRHDLLSQTMLVRDDDGYYRPAHKSLIEFFSAYKLAAAIGVLKEEYVEAARGHANVDKNREPAEQQWSSYFRASGGEGQVLAPLARFAKESTAELEKTWAQVVLDDATSELILLMCGKSALLRYVKNQNSSDAIESKVAARALQVAAFSGDLRGADLSGAIVSDCHLRHCDLSHVNLSGSSWLEGSVGQVSLDHASLREVYFRLVMFIDVTLRDADLSNGKYEVNNHYTNIIGGIWGIRDDKEILLIVLADGRFLVINPTPLVVQELVQPKLEDVVLTREELIRWLFEQNNPLDLGGGVGHVSLNRSGWYAGWHWINNLAKGLRIVGTDSTAAGGDVEITDIEVTDKSTQQVLLNFRLHDTTDYASGNTYLRALAISKNGKQLAVVHGSFGDEEAVSICSDNSTEGTPLRDFGGYIVDREEHSRTIDERDAAFSPVEILLRSVKMKTWSPSGELTTASSSGV